MSKQLKVAIQAITDLGTLRHALTLMGFSEVDVQLSPVCNLDYRAYVAHDSRQVQLRIGRAAFGGYGDLGAFYDNDGTVVILLDDMDAARAMLRYLREKNPDGMAHTNNVLDAIPQWYSAASLMEAMEAEYGTIPDLHVTDDGRIRIEIEA